MIYKRYELSLSQNGPDLVHIARNAAGNVVFREPSEKELKAAIDKAEEERLRAIEAEEKKKAEAEKKKSEKKKKGLFQPEPGEVAEAGENAEPEQESILAPSTPPQERVTRGPDGKFISKSQLDVEEPKKKGFWDKLTG